MKDAEFADMVQKYQKLIYSICFQMVQDYHIAEDLTQETFSLSIQPPAKLPNRPYTPMVGKNCYQQSKGPFEKCLQSQGVSNRKGRNG